MSFDLLIGLIVIVATIAQAIVSRRSKRTGQPPPPPGTAPAAPPKAQPGQQEASFGRRLEEARRRVQEAKAGSGSPGGDLLSRGEPGPQAAPRRQSFEGDKQEGRVTAAAGRTYAPNADDTALEVAPAMRVQRTARTKTARLSSGELLQFDPVSITRGVIWNQVLSTPLSRQGSRRKPSRRP